MCSRIYYPSPTHHIICPLLFPIATCRTPTGWLSKWHFCITRVSSSSFPSSTSSSSVLNLSPSLHSSLTLTLIPRSCSNSASNPYLLHSSTIIHHTSRSFFYIHSHPLSCSNSIPPYNAFDCLIALFVYYHCLLFVFIAYTVCELFMDYYSMYPWAKLNIIREVYVFTSIKRIWKLRHAQSLSRTSSEKDVIIIPCKPK